MRCPKCGYISFDYNKFCPKCNKDISEEQTKLNLHSYMHNAPSLLGMLVGAGDESSSGLILDSATALQRAGAALDDQSPAIMENDMDFGDDDQDLEISLSDDTELELPEISMDDQSSEMDNLELVDDEDLSLEPDEEVTAPPAAAEDTGDDLSLDLGDISMKGEKGFSTVELNMRDLKINDTGELEIDSFSDEIKKLAAKNSDSQILDVNRTSHLDLSDLTFDEETAPGLGIEESNGTVKTRSPGKKDKEDSLDLGDLALDDGDLITDKDNEGLDLDSLTFEDTDESDSTSASMAETLNISDLSDNGTGSFDLEDLAISEEDSATPEENDGIDLSDLSFDEEDLKGTGSNLFTGAMDLDNQETGELELDSIDIEVAEGDSQDIGKSETIDDSQAFDLDSLEGNNLNDSMTDLTIDLENLDLDLDLDTPEDKK